MAIGKGATVGPLKANTARDWERAPRASGSEVLDRFKELLPHGSVQFPEFLDQPFQLQGIQAFLDALDDTSAISSAISWSTQYVFPGLKHPFIQSRSTIPPRSIAA